MLRTVDQEQLFMWKDDGAQSQWLNEIKKQNYCFSVFGMT